MRLRDSVLIAWFSTIAGCGVVGSTSIKPPAVNPSQAAEAAIQFCDKDANGLLTAAELATSPGLLSALTKYDTSGDKQLDREEIAAGLSAIYSSRTALTSFICRVTFDNRPLSGAQVRFIPESFLGGDVKPGSGVTEGSGNVSLGIADEDLPEILRGSKKMQLGLYRVEITHPSAKIPAKYNTQTTLGCEISPIDPDEPVVFRLKSK